MKKEYETIKISHEGSVARISFCRPEVHNAFNDTLIYEMTDLFTALKEDKDLRREFLSQIPSA